MPFLVLALLLLLLAVVAKEFQKILSMKKRKGKEGKNTTILDLDLDAFSVENPGTQLMRVRYNMTAEDIGIVYMCSCQPHGTSCEATQNRGRLWVETMQGAIDYAAPEGLLLPNFNFTVLADVFEKYMPIREMEGEQEESKLEQYLMDLIEIYDHLCNNPVHYRSLDGSTPTPQFPAIEMRIMEALHSQLSKPIRVVYIDSCEEPGNYIFTPVTFGMRKDQGTLEDEIERNRRHEQPYNIP
eukprot:jgi/Bigna1/75300/fgenesh1_pg.33_\